MTRTFSMSNLSKPTADYLSNNYDSVFISGSSDVASSNSLQSTVHKKWPALTLTPLSRKVIPILWTLFHQRTYISFGLYHNKKNLLPSKSLCCARKNYESLSIKRKSLQFKFFFRSPILTSCTLSLWLGSLWRPRVYILCKSLPLLR